MRLAVIRQHYGKLHYLRSLFDEIDELTDVTTFGDDVCGNGPSSLPGFGDLNGFGVDADAFDAILWFPTYQRMSVLPDFDWAGFRGRRVLLDFDACQNYSTISSNDRLGTYVAEIRRHRIDTVVVSGRHVRDRLRQEGVDAVWMPSATDPNFFLDNTAVGERVVHFGTRYPARRQMLREVRRAGFEVEHASCPREELAALLSKVGVGLICDMQASPILPVPKSLFRKLPPFLYSTTPGIEPMMKQYEYASAGVLLVCDRQPDREYLGFIDRQTCFSYTRLESVASSLRAALDSLAHGNEVSDAAKSMTTSWHTWSRRAPALLSACGPNDARYLDADYRPR